MAREKYSRYSGIGGQAVLEGVMMKNREKYAVAVRKPDGGIEVELENYQGVIHGSKLKEIPFIRGIFNFIDSLVLGMRCLNFSASFYEEDEGNKNGDNGGGKLLTGIITVFSVVLAVGIFVVLPYFLASLTNAYVRNASLVTIIEGVIRIAVFLIYVCSISLMKDIRRLYRYHGAEHKCINCIERGYPLTVKNAMHSSRLHKRCGTSFIFFVLFVSIILFFFIRVDNVFQKVILRVLLMPVIAGISYEIIRLAGRSNNIFVRIISAPGMLVQRMTTKEPDEDMVEVAIAAVEAVFDWNQYLIDNFGYEVDQADADFEEEDAVYEAEDGIYGEEDGIYGEEDAVYGAEDGIYEGEDGVYEGEDAVFEEENVVFEDENVVFEEENAVFDENAVFEAAKKL